MQSSDQSSEEEEEEEEDRFDRLPDPLVLLIFNHLQDVKSLGRCCSVSRRFHALALQTESVLVRVDCVVSGDPVDRHHPDPDRPRGVLTNLANLLLRPLHALHEILLPKKILLADVSHHSPSDVLSHFRHIRSLTIVLPSGELGVDPGAVLKWNAEFGCSLESCAVLGATSFRNKDPAVADTNPDPSVEDLSFCTNGGLKLRVVWTITSLIAASARHYLLRQIVSDHLMLRSLEITDADGQGTLRMGREQLAEFRRSPLEPSDSTSNRTQVPALNMKLWYAPRLELRSGYVMEGATLVAIRPVDRPIKVEGDGFVEGAFEGPFAEAAKAMVNMKTYLLEMNPF